MLVEKTGVESTLGQLSTLLGGLHAEKPPLETRLDAFGSRVARWVFVVAAMIVVLGVTLEGWGRCTEVFVFAVALAVAAVPEGLPAVLTTTLALGTERMARRQAVVRRLAAVEALGSVTVIATDKTGTLTENRMQVRALDAPNEEALLRAMVLANDADLTSGVGDPLELALLAYALDTNPNLVTLRQLPRCSSRPFDALWKYMHVSTQEEGRVVSYLKGAPEVVLERSTLSPSQRSSWLGKTAAYGAQGFRPLALATGTGEQEDALTFLGLVLLWDPARPEVPEAVQRAQAAGIRVLMMTGDHPATALAVAASVGIGGLVLVGSEIDALGDRELEGALASHSVLARVTPEHKLRVVETLKAAGEIVAVTGDGVNDAPALKRAHVGVAMGGRGSDVTREVADLVLLDDNFATIVSAVEEGRSIFANIQKFVRFLFATNLSEVLVVIFGVGLAAALGLRTADGGLLLPLTAVQILWINLVTDALPALALALDRNPGTMDAAPRSPQSPLLGRPSVTFIALSAGTLSGLLLLVFSLAPAWGMSAEVARTTGFTILVLGQLSYTFSSRRLDAAPLPNRALVAAVGVCVLLQLLTLFTPLLQRLLGLVALPPPAVALALGGSGLIWLLSERLGAVIYDRGNALPTDP